MSLLKIRTLSPATRMWAMTTSFVLGLLIAASFGTLAPHGLFGEPWELGAWIMVALLAGLHRPFRDRPATLGLGTMVLPLAAIRLGVVPAALVATFSLWGAELVRRMAKGVEGAPQDGVSTAVRTGAATLVAGGFTVSLASFVPLPFGLQVLLTALVYAIVLAFLVVRATNEWNAATPLVLDLAGWALGGALALVSARSGWSLAGWIALAMSLLMVEAARNALLRGASDSQVGGLRRLHRAHARILGEISEVTSVAQQIWIECCNVLPVDWFEFELLAGSGEDISWYAGPERVMKAGRAKPPKRPAVLPGVHRRAEWRIIEKILAWEGKNLAVVKLWCDPRRIDGGAEELLDSLLPHMQSAVHRVLLEKEAKLDPLTEIPVRRLFDTNLQSAYDNCRENGSSLGLIMCDIDHFKRVNDTYGHLAGDQALRLVAKALDGGRRERDLCCRYGGEEFAVLLEDTESAAALALALAERLRKAVEAVRFEVDGKFVPLTLSVGVAAFPEIYVKTGSELVLLADEALYEAKRRGRNRALRYSGPGRFEDQDRALQTAEPATTPRFPRFFS